MPCVYSRSAPSRYGGTLGGRHDPRAQMHKAARCRRSHFSSADLEKRGIAGASGLIAGGLLGRSLATSVMRPADCVAAAPVTGLTPSLGCLALSAGTAIGASVGIAAGTALALVNARQAV